jgi:hypothetical protein
MQVPPQPQPQPHPPVRQVRTWALVSHPRQRHIGKEIRCDLRTPEDCQFPSLVLRLSSGNVMLMDFTTVVSAVPKVLSRYGRLRFPVFQRPMPSCHRVAEPTDITYSYDGCPMPVDARARRNKGISQRRGILNLPCVLCPACV